MANDNVPFGEDTNEAVGARKQTEVGAELNIKNGGATALPGSGRTSAGGVEGVVHGSIQKPLNPLPRTELAIQENPNLQIASTTNEIQTISFSPTAHSGNYTLNFAGAATSPLLATTTSTSLESSLEGLSSIGEGNVSVVGATGGAYTVSFINDLNAGQNVPLMTVTDNFLSGILGTVAINISEIDGAVSYGDLSLGDVRLGTNGFGSNKAFVQEITADDRVDVSRDNIEMPSNQNSQNNESIPNVASRFLR